MKRFIFGSLLVCLVLLSSGLFIATKVGAQQPSKPGIQRSFQHSPISDAQIKEMVRQRFGQQAMDAMKYRSTQSQVSAPPPALLKHFKSIAASRVRTTAPRAQANGQELYVDDPEYAGYGINAEGASWVQGASASFNASKSNAVPPAGDGTYVILTNSSSYDLGSEWIIAGVSSDGKTLSAYVYWLNWNDWGHPHGGYNNAIFPVQPGDKINVLIHRYNPGDPWAIAVEDVTNAKYQWFYESDNTDSLTRAYWVLDTYEAPIAPRTPWYIDFTNAQWYSNWAGWQPIDSSATHTYSEITNISPQGGEVDPGGLVDTVVSTINARTTVSSFALIPICHC